MSEKWSDPRVMPDRTHIDRHSFTWWVIMWLLGIASWAFVLIAAWWVFKR